MRKKWFLGGIVLLCAGGGAWWFWSLGNLPAENVSSIQLVPEQGIVSVQHKGTQGWESVSKESGVAPGDTIRTGEGAGAVLKWYGEGESRIQANSQVTVQEAVSQIDADSPLRVKLALLSGRVWTRMERLLDMQSSFAVKANGVTATVRGTAFDVQVAPTGTVVWVSDSGVQVQGQRSSIINEGTKSSFDQNGREVATSTLSPEDMKSDWFVQNTDADTNFVKSAQSASEARFAALGGASPDSLANSVVQASERLHLALNSNAAPELYARYSIRRLYQTIQLVRAGKSGLAYRAMSPIENDIDVHLKGPNGDAYRAALIGQLNGLSRLLETVDPTSAVYPLKQRFEDLQQSITANMPVQYMYAKLLSIESSLTAADELLDHDSSSTVSSLLDAADFGLDNVAQDIFKSESSTAPGDVDILRTKLSALRIREAGLRSRLNAPPAPTELPPLPMEGSTTSTSSTLGIPPVATSTTATTSTEPAPLQSIFLSIAPNPVQVGATSQLTVKGLRADGSRVDLTANARYQVIGTVGAVNGPAFSSPVVGQVTIEARVVEQGKAFTSRAGVQIMEAAKTPVRLDVIPLSQNSSVPPGGQLSLRTVATYSDGSTKDVTDGASFTVSDQRLGSMTGNVFTATQSLTVGSLRITAKYQEATASVTGFIDVSIR